jgi:uncharacterized membrane protein
MKREWFLRRNCSLSPRQFGAAYLLLCTGAFSIAFVFALMGIWIVFAFALVEMAGVTAALLHYARHATDHEHIALTERCLLVENVRGGRTEKVGLDPHWTRIDLPDNRRHRLIGLESRGVKVEIGRYVTEATRQKVAQELRQELRSSSFLS